MSCEIKAPVIIDSARPSYCYVRRCPIVFYKARHLSSTNQQIPLTMNANVVENDEDERLEPGTCTFVHAIVNNGSDGADIDVDVLSIGPLDGLGEPKPPGLISATGTTVGVHFGPSGRWIVIEGGDDDAAWMLS